MQRPVIIWMIAALSFGAGQAVACPILKQASPRVGSAVAGDIGAVRLEFSGPVFADASRIDVTDAQGRAVNSGAAYLSGENAVATKINLLPAGKYKVTWSVLCDCGEMNPGDYKFTVADPVD